MDEEMKEKWTKKYLILSDEDGSFRKYKVTQFFYQTCKILVD